MPEPTVDRDPVEILAEEFVDRLRDGDRPSVEEYAIAHPEWAEQIRDLFPTIAAMENLKLDKEVSSGGRASLGPIKIERLGDLRIIREIGRGGMGIVYEAEQESLGRRVAVKVLPKQSLLDDKHLRRFRREAKTAAKLHHTNIVPILGVGEQDGFHYYVMQIIRGAGLDEIILQLKQLATGSRTEAVPASLQPQRTTNVSSVARALMHGELRSLAKVNDSQSSGNESGSQPSSGTDSNREAITTSVDGKEDPILVDDSFLIAEGPSSPIDADSAANSELASVATQLSPAYWQNVARIGVQVAKALNYAHRQGTLHRDIKPANLLIDEDGTVWVADFGLAKAMEHDNVSRTGDIVGTLRYMAPEQFQGSVDGRSDIYSLGLTLYELLTLKPAFDETQRKRSFLHDSGPLEPHRPRRDNPAIPRDLETIVLKAIAVEPGARYQSSAELAEDLERFLEDRPILARRASIPERFGRWARRNPAVAGLSGLAISLLLLVAIVSTTAYFRTKNARDAAVTAEGKERLQRVKAEATSELAWNALDKIFERLAPHRYVSPEDFAVVTEESTSFKVNTQPVLSNEAAALLDEMLVFYRRLAAQGDDTDEFRQRIAEANRRVGDIRQRLGQYGQAGQAYRQAIAMYSQLEDGGKTDPKQAAALASIYNQLGEVLRSSSEFDLARDAFDNARTILEPVATKSSPPEVRYELARSFYLRVHRFSGPVPSQGPGFGGPNGKRGGSRRDGKGGPPSPPGDAARSGEGSRSGSGSGSNFRHYGDFGRDAENIARAIALLEELTAEYKVPDYQQLLALCYAERPRTLRFEDRDKSDQAISKAISLLEDLVTRYPQNPDYRFTLSTVYTTGLYRFWTPPSEDELANIETRALTASKLLDDLHRDHPGVPDYVQSQLGVRSGLAMLFSRAGRFEDAQLHYQDAIRMYDSLNAPESSMLSRMANLTRHSYADMLLKHYRKVKEAGGEAQPEWLIQARELLQVSLDKVKPLADAGLDPGLRVYVGYLYKGLAKVAVELGDEAATASATESMKKYLPQDRWDDSERREEWRPPGGDRGSGNRPNAPRGERPTRDAERGS